MSGGNRSDILGRVIGMLVFLLGVGLLIYVFMTAYHLFSMPAAGALGITLTGNPKTDPSAATIGTQITWLLMRLAYLFLMSIAASLIANKGINLYFSALHGSPVNVLHRAAAPAPPVAVPPSTDPQV